MAIPTSARVRAGSIVDFIAYHGHTFALGLQLRNFLVFVLRQNLGKDVIYAQLGSDRLGNGTTVAGQHCNLETHGMQALHGLFAFRSHHIGYRECSDHPFINNQVDHRLSLLPGLFDEI